MMGGDYLSFLKAFRKIIESNGSPQDKKSAIRSLAESDSTYLGFINRHGGVDGEWMDKWLGYDDFLGISGIQMKVAKSLYEAGFRSSEDLRHAEDKQLTAVKGIGPATVRKIREILSRLESGLQIIIKGVPEKLANDIGNAVAGAVKGFKKADRDLDLRRMHRIVLTADFAGELAELSRATVSGTPITHTDEDYAIAVAKVLILPRDEEYEIVLVVNANVAAALVPKNQEDYSSEGFRTVLHLLHHELCHVHDDNKKIDAFHGLMLRYSYEGKDKYIRPLAEGCWSEYIANFMSSSTTDEGWVADMAGSLADAIGRTKRELDREILEYRYDGNLEHLLDYFQRHGVLLIITAARNLGYLDGLRISLEELSAEAFDSLTGSYFEPTWNVMQSALRKMRSTYPDGWNDLSIYDGLADVLEDYYAVMGFNLSSTEEGQIYVDIPLRPETTPNL